MQNNTPTPTPKQLENFSPPLYAGLSGGNPPPRSRTNRSGKRKRTPPIKARTKGQKYRDHSQRRTRIAEHKLPQPPAWVVALVPERILRVYRVLMLLTQGGRFSRVYIATIAARTGLCERSVRYAIEYMETCFVLRVIENRVSYKWSNPNSFIFLNINPFDGPLNFINCRQGINAFNAKTRYTASGQKPSREGEQKAKSAFRILWEQRYAENHNPEQRRDWYERRLKRRKLNYRPDVRAAYEAQGERWQLLKEWRAKQRHNREYWNMQANVGVYRSEVTPVEPVTSELEAQERELQEWRERKRLENLARIAQDEARRAEWAELSKKRQESVSEPLTAEQQARIDAMKQKIAAAGGSDVKSRLFFTRNSKNT